MNRLQQRLSQHIKSWCEDKKNLDGVVYVVYLFDKNRLMLLVDFYTKKQTKDQLKALCKEAVEVVRRFLGLIDGKPIIESGNSNLGPVFFGHSGDSKDNKPKNTGKELDNITIIKVSAASSQPETTPANTFVRCEAPLLGTKILFAESD